VTLCHVPEANGFDTLMSWGEVGLPCYISGTQLCSREASDWFPAYSPGCAIPQAGRTDSVV
jgi:hypothetical protein